MHRQVALQYTVPRLITTDSFVPLHVWFYGRVFWICGSSGASAGSSMPSRPTMSPFENGGPCMTWHDRRCGQNFYCIMTLSTERYRLLPFAKLIRPLFWSCFDVNRSTVDEDIIRKKFHIFCSQWSWPWPLTFRTKICYTIYSSPELCYHL